METVCSPYLNSWHKQFREVISFVKALKSDYSNVSLNIITGQRGSYFHLSFLIRVRHDVRVRPVRVTDSDGDFNRCPIQSHSIGQGEVKIVFFLWLIWKALL